MDSSTTMPDFTNGITVSDVHCGGRLVGISKGGFVCMANWEPRVVHSHRVYSLEIVGG